MQTNEGHHAAACGLDYFRPHLFYDTFAMRDIDGNPMIAILFPFFPQGKTRQQLMAHSTKIELKSCWNGMSSAPTPPPLPPPGKNPPTTHGPQHKNRTKILMGRDGVPPPPPLPLFPFPNLPNL